MKVGEGVKVEVGIEVLVAVGVGVEVSASVGVGVGVNVEVSVTVGVGVALSTGVTVGVAVGDRQNAEPVATTVLVVSRTSMLSVPYRPVVLILKD